MTKIRQTSVLRKAIIALFCIGAIIAGVLFVKILRADDSKSVTQQASDKIFTQAELALYNGSDPTKPIYLGMNGLVYDVTAGREYYQPGGTYHWLAGKDSSADLNLVGGEIIKRKYPVVGSLVP
jgi:predicted heme/steroid binding protein